MAGWSTPTGSVSGSNGPTEVPVPVDEGGTGAENGPEGLAALGGVTAAAASATAAGLITTHNASLSAHPWALLGEVDFTTAPTANWLITPPTEIMGIPLSDTVIYGSAWTSLGIGASGLGGVSGGAGRGFNLRWTYAAIFTALYGRAATPEDQIQIEIQCAATTLTANGSQYRILALPATGVQLEAGIQNLHNGTSQRARQYVNILGAATNRDTVLGTTRSLGLAILGPGRARATYSTGTLPVGAPLAANPIEMLGLTSNIGLVGGTYDLTQAGTYPATPYFQWGVNSEETASFFIQSVRAWGRRG